MHKGVSPTQVAFGAVGGFWETMSHASELARPGGEGAGVLTHHSRQSLRAALGEC